MRTIQPKIPEIPGGNTNGTEILGKKFSKIWVYLARLSSFPEIPENAVLFALLEISENSNRNLWSNEKRPRFDLTSDWMSKWRELYKSIV